ncbi:peptidoglycan D,D-transpeptidase FtsI family protein [Stakelama tenebrarum]|uniref:Penicillin-binding protein 2 n=1 Tax=Stakelama tenebrarum TaxID=2711215 RepID=A0A6G6Y4E6_9SPHN|nr:penicillin-binding protein 2 [Sphingosinithalassobacter tenebrarum]QIG79802.1 penicillin-binding protein 2 [Sphingosinithalassobacter tenebrarum]
MIVLVAPPAESRRAGGGRQAMVAVAQVRLMILLLAFAAGIFAILARLAVLAIWAEPASARNTAAVVKPLRGDIADRNGEPLARTIDAWTIGVHPGKLIGDRRELARSLAEIMPDRSADDYYKLLTADGFRYLKRRARPELVSAVNALGEPGIGFNREPERLYPQGDLAAYVLGHLHFDGYGVRGMERVLEDRLTDPAQSGAPVELSIDIRAQAALRSELGDAMESFQAKGAAGLILDVDTGEIMAMVSLPGFNPNDVHGTLPLNNVTQSVYELGSTFKPIAAATAIDTGVVTSMARRFDATEPLRIGRFSIRDDHPQKRWLNIPETLVYSSNIATARIGEELGEERFAEMFRKLHFDDRAPIEIEGGGTLWPSYWGRATTMTVGYGHGIAVTPLHLALAYAAIVNGGVWRPATLMKVEPGHAVAGERVISAESSARMRQLMRLIVTEGTGRNADVLGYRVGGKTGTAEKPGEHGYSSRNNVSTFAAAFPMDAPRYVVIAMLDSPVGNAQSHGQRTAGWTAAPVVGRVIQRTGPMLGVIPDPRRDVDLSDVEPLIWKGPQEHEVASQ